jgi:hypothetical protein
MKGAAKASSSKAKLTKKEKEKAKRQRPTQAEDNDGDDDEIVNTTKREFGRSTRKEPTSHPEVSQYLCQLRTTDTIIDCLARWTCFGPLTAESTRLHRFSS